MITVSCAILWCLFACLNGYIQAYHFHYRESSTNNDAYNEHLLFTIHRLCVLIPIGYILVDWRLILSIIPMFTMWHDGVYYFQRNRLDKSYPKGFWDQSTTSTSWLDMKHLTSPILRVIFFLIGLAGLIIFNINK